MSTPSSPPSFQKNWNETFQEFIDWLSENKQIFIGILLGLIVLLFGAYRYFAYQNAATEANFYKAQTLFNQVQQTIVTDPEAAKEPFAELKELLKKYPSIQAKYDGKLAQDLIIANDPVEATPFVQAIAKRTRSDDLGDYQSFSQTSLLISEKNYTKAIGQAQALKQTLDGEPNLASHSTLYALNLIRLAILHAYTNQLKEEKQFWDLVERYLSSSKNGQELMETLKVGKTSIQDYIKERQNA